MHSTDEKKPTGSSNFTAGGTDLAIVSDAIETSGSIALTIPIEFALRAWCTAPPAWLQALYQRPRHTP